MATLTVWKFDTPSGADDASATLQGLAKQNLIVLHDAATVSWEDGKKKPKTRQLASTTAVFGQCWRIILASHTPLGPGRCKSQIATVGRLLASIPTASNASHARATL